MINWYEDNALTIQFDSEPNVSIRYILPSYDESVKKSIKKYPFINKTTLHVYVKNNKDDRIYDFEIPKGYCFDGASVPRFFWRVIGSNTDNKFIIAAMVHDYICENHSVVGYDRKLSTNIFNSLLKVSEVGKFKRYLMKNSVDIFQKCFCHW